MAFFRRDNKRNLRDEDLISLYRSSGDTSIIGELFTRYTHLVYGVCLKYLGNREDAKDAVMAIFEKLIADLPKYDIEKFTSWLYVLSKNHCLMKLRSQKAMEKHQTKWINSREVFMENEAFLHPLDEQSAINDKALFDCIEKLKKEQKKCIELFYFKNKCYQEIAEELSADEKKVKSHLQNGKRNLKICLENTNEKDQ